MENKQKDTRIKISWDVTTDRKSPCMPQKETPMSRRYLALLQNWVPFGMQYFKDWPVRPDCGHFFGGVYWYGLETASPLLVLSALISSPEYDSKITGYTKDDLIKTSVKALRYLCFTHDTGPKDCVRPAGEPGDVSLYGTKWGERGKGFFTESQCGVTLSKMVKSALILRPWLNRETWMMLAAICADYLKRFANMPPKSGVYFNTQAEENVWTAMGLTAATLFLSRHKSAVKWEESAKHWMFCAATVPDDRYDMRRIKSIDPTKIIRGLCSNTVTILPDFMAENHGIVHPNYTIAVFGVAGFNLYRLFGKKNPEHFLWHRREIYDNLKRLSDRYGRVHPVQGMDWPYLTSATLPFVHCFARLYMKDPDAAYYENAALELTEKIIQGNNGRIINPDVFLHCSNHQDPMILWEQYIASLVPPYLAHRLFAEEPAVRPTGRKRLFAKYSGVKVYPHSGFVFHRHGKGQTSFSWRNQVMALPLTSEGLLTIAPSFGSVLGKIKVKEFAESRRIDHVHINELKSGFAATMIATLNDSSIRQEVMLASLPDGRLVCREVFHTLKDCTVERVQQGYLEIMNEKFPKLRTNCTGFRKLYSVEGTNTFISMVRPDSCDDEKVEMESPGWLNLDDRMGIIIASAGHRALYHNRHFFKPYRGITDELFLNLREGKHFYKKNRVVADIIFMLSPDEKHAETPSQRLIPAKACSEGTWGILAGQTFVAGNIDAYSGSHRFEFKRSRHIPVFAGLTKIEKDRVIYEIEVLQGQSLWLEPLTIMGKPELCTIGALPNGKMYFRKNSRNKNS